VKVPAARIVFPEADRREILDLVDESLRSGSLTLGPHTRAFEEAFAAVHQAPCAVATSSGTSALEILMRALRVDGPAAADAAPPPGSGQAAGEAQGSEAGEVIVPANTFFATAAAVLHAGGRVRLADVDAATLALSPASVEAALTERTVGVVHVHIGGLVSPDLPALAELCRERGLWLVEDAAHAHGSSHGGRMAGTFGRAAAFSFYPTKVVTSGEGGMIVTGDEHLRDEAVVYRDQGKAGFLGGDHVRLGYAWRMSEVHAAIGLVHLRRLGEAIARRNEVARRYDDVLAATPGITPVVPPLGGTSNYYKYVALLDGGIDRGRFKRALLDDFGVAASGEVYAAPLHHQPIFEALDHPPLPVAEDVCARQICLPIHSDMTEDETAHVLAAVREVLARHG
jgi:dTDP-4-amino-4,6-dideoxygalactose transaminase